MRRLLEELDGEEIEIKSLEEVVDRFVIGEEKISKGSKNDGNYPAIVCREIFENNFYIDECRYFVDETKLKKLPIVECGDILMANSGYTIKNKGGFCLYSGEFKALAGKNIYILKHSQNPKYLSFALSSRNVEEQMECFFKMGLSSLLSIYLYDIKKLKVPIPSLNIQRLVAEFLFIFIKYDKILHIELERRRKQFEFYKEKIFREGIEELNWEIKNIEDIASEIYLGNQVTREQLGTGNCPAVKCGDINSHLPLQFEECISFVDPNLIKKPRYFEYGDVLISNMAGKVEHIGTPTVYLGKDKCLAGDHVVIIKTNQNSKFLAHILSSKFVKDQIEKLVQKSTIYDLYLSKIKQIQIPTPSLEEQERIVKILDRLYDMCENPDRGIRALIKLNQKQYEYYKELIFGKMVKI